MSTDLRSTDLSRPGPARSTLEKLRVRWGVVEDWSKAPAVIFVQAPSGTESWWRVSDDVYELREVRRAS